MGLRVLPEESDGGGEFGGVAGEPGGEVGVGGAGLSGGGASEVEGGGAGAVWADDVAQDVGDGVGGAAVEGGGGGPVGQVRYVELPGAGVDPFQRGDRPGAVCLAVVGQGGVDAGQVEGAGGGGAEGHRGVGRVHAGHVGGDAEPDGGLPDVGEAGVHPLLRVHRVDGLDHGLAQGDGAVVDVVLVGRRVRGGAVGDGAFAGAVVVGLGADREAVGAAAAVGGEAGGEVDRFEGGADLVVLAQCVVVGLSGVVGAAVDGDDAAGGGFDGGAGDADVGVGGGPGGGVEFGGEFLVDGAGEGVLLVLVEGGGDAPAAGLEGGGVEDAVGDQVVVGDADQVAGLAGQAGGGLRVDRVGEGGVGAFGGADEAELDHAVEGVLPAGEGAFAVGGGGGLHVVGAGGLEQGGEVGALREGEFGDVGAVVGAGGALDAVGAAAEVAGVEVAGEDLVLVALLVDLEGDKEFAALAFDGPALGEVVVLDVLLGDGGAALHALAGQGVPAGPDHALQVDAAVLVEGAVLGGDDGLPGADGDLLDADVGAVDGPGAGDLGDAVGVEVDVALGDGLGVGVGQRDDDVEHGEGADGDQQGAEHGAEADPPGGQQPPQQRQGAARLAAGVPSGTAAGAQGHAEIMCYLTVDQVVGRGRAAGGKPGAHRTVRRYGERC
nr:hypothetical protein [Streptomyces sp. TLI_053]